MICIIDYGVGNLGAVSNMLKRLGIEVVTSGDPEVIARADKLLLPGVGSFDYAMERLHSTGLYTVLDHQVRSEKKPILGICLGMQLMCNGSEEGQLPGFGWIDADVTKFHLEGLKVPHMGWNHVAHRSSSLTTSSDRERYYFVHSYFVTCHNSSDIMYTTVFGNEFVSGFRRENVIGVQFHPEKSHRFGMELLRSYCES